MKYENGTMILADDIIEDSLGETGDERNALFVVINGNAVDIDGDVFNYVFTKPSYKPVYHKKYKKLVKKYFVEKPEHVIVREAV